MGSNYFSDSGLKELTRNIMIMTIVALLIIMIFIILVLFCSKQRRRVTEAATDDNNNCVSEQRGLDDSLLKIIPVVEFDPKSFEEGLECAVCLSEVTEGEKARILPKCDHGFHMECIDMWFHSHSTCPVCRNTIVDESGMLEELQQDYSATVLVVGDEADDNHQCLNTEQASSSSSMWETNKNIGGSSDLVIDIPGGKEEEDEKSPVSCSGMRSLTRMLSSGSRRFNAFNPGSGNAPLHHQQPSFN